MSKNIIQIYIFVTEYHEQCLRSVLETSDERKITVLLANHLLSRLIATSPGHTYCITDDHWWQYELCPCDEQCGDKIWYGNSGIGTELLWYGKPDIMLFPLGGNCSIVIPKDKNLENLLENEEQQVDTDIKKRVNIIKRTFKCKPVCGTSNYILFLSETISTLKASLLSTKSNTNTYNRHK
ncbi:uncharacterized protein [Mytilus edulis]|uniref:uncharacterized protein n=1 Tax=Mytilus edulis TaxID=6550 RepID=UPI0039F04109